MHGYAFHRLKISVACVFTPGFITQLNSAFPSLSSQRDGVLSIYYVLLLVMTILILMETVVSFVLDINLLQSFLPRA
jgi:hypothetical protein